MSDIIDRAMAWYYWNSKKSGSLLTYISVPDAPAFGTTTIIEPTDTEIATADLDGNTDIILASGTHTPRVSLYQLSGYEGTPVRFKGEGDKATIIGDGTEVSNSILYGNASDWIEIYNVKVKYGGGFVWELSSGNILVQDIEVEGDEANGFSGFRSKTDNDNTVTPYKIEIYYSYFYNVIGEGIYIGQVNGTTYHNISQVILNHIRAVDCGREPVQFSHIVDLSVNHFTGIRAGQTDESSQNRAFQVQDCNGEIKNSLFHSIGTLGQAYMSLHNSDGITYKNCYFEAEEPFYIGNATAKDWYANSTIKGNKDIILDGCILNRTSGGSITDLLTVYFDKCNIIVKNCLISDNITALFNDQRSDKVTYSLIDGGGNEYVSSSHESMNPTFDSQDRVTSSYHYTRGMGRMVSDPEEPSYSYVTISGTETSGQILSASVSGGDAGCGSSIDNTTYQWYVSDDASGTNRAKINGEVYSTLYLTRSLEAKHTDVEAYPSNDYKISGTSTSAKTGAIAVGAWHPLLDASWDVALLPEGAADLATNEYWENDGAYGNATYLDGSNYPSYGSGIVNFDASNYEVLTCPKPSYSTDYEVWVEFTPDNTNFKYILGLSNGVYLRMQSGGALNWAGTNVGYTCSAGVTYRVRLYLNGASSTIEVRDSSNSVLLAESTVTLGTATTGASDTIIGGAFNLGSTSFDGSMKHIFMQSGSLGTSDKASMWSWF